MHSHTAFPVGPLAGLLLALALASCVDRAAATALADTGQKAAASGSAVIAGSIDDLDHYLEAEYFLAGFRPGTEAGLAATASNIDSIKHQLTARGAMLTSLAAVYGKFAELIAFNSAPDVKKATDSLLTTSEAFANSLTGHGGSLFTDQEKDIISKAAGAVEIAVQDKAIRDHSNGILTVLTKVTALLEQEQAHVDAFAKLRIAAEYNVLQTLWNQGVGMPNAIVKTFLADSGLDYDPAQLKDMLELSGRIEDLKKDKEWMDTKGNAAKLVRAESLHNAVGLLLQHRHEQRNALHAAILSGTIKAFKELASAHRALTAELPVSLDGAKTLVQRVRDDLSLLTPAPSK